MTALVKSRERKSHYNVGRITNSLGWLHQEFGDFRGALELDREATELGRRHRIGNVEVSATSTSATISCGWASPPRR